MEILGSYESELTSGYKLVPWSSWDQWNSVRESIFSSSPQSVTKALQRISTWRSRGCLPVPIDVTAAFVEIQQKDPEFSVGTESDVLQSEEMLTMLYCMAIMRLVNCFVEPAHKKTGRSISQLADAIGIPRMLIDIRHESSHRNLPSLLLVRMASKEAVDWLKSNYWEPQRRAIPDVRKEVRYGLREMSFLLKSKHAKRSGFSQGNGKRFKRSGVVLRHNKLSSQIAGKLLASKSDGSDRRISKITNRISRLYSSCPSQVLAVLLEFFNLQTPVFSDDIDMDDIDTECSDESNDDDLGPLVDSICDLKMIIIKLSSKTPGLVLAILKTVLEMIESKESALSEKGGLPFLSSKYQNKMADINRLFSLVRWLLMRLKVLKDSGQVGAIGESPMVSVDGNASLYVSLTKLLQKLLSLSVIGDEHLSSSVRLLAEMIGDKTLTTKIKKIPLPAIQDQDSIEEPSTFLNVDSMILQEEASFNQATKMLEALKLQLRNRKNRITNLMPSSNRMWTVSKSWIPCPIGMLPCSFSSTAVLPDLNMEEDLETQNLEENSREAELKRVDVLNKVSGTEKREEADADLDENESASKQLRMTEEDETNLPEKLSPMEGLLFIGGVWKKVSEEELLDIESRIKVFVELVAKQS